MPTLGDVPLTYWDSTALRYRPPTSDVFSYDNATGILSLKAGKTFVWSATSGVSFFGAPTVAAQPASGDQAALALDVDVTGADTVDKAAVNANFSAIQTLVNRLRTDLITYGLIKGSA